MAGNESVLTMETVPSPIGGLLYVVKDTEDYKVEIGVPLGVAYIDATGKIPTGFLDLSWDNITSKPATFTPSAHTHDAADIVSGTIDPARLPSSGTTTVTWANVSGKPVYATRWPSWEEVTGAGSAASYDADSLNVANTVALRTASGDVIARLFRSEYPDETTMGGALAFRHNNSTNNFTRYISDPAAVRDWMEVPHTSHTHPWADITGEPVYTTRWPTWNEVSGKPSTFTPTSHTHPHTQITGLGSAATADYSQSSTPFTLAQRTGSGTINAVDFVSTSDERLKTNIKDRTPRDLALLLRFVSYIWTASNEESLGLIAQEVRKIAPEYVHEDGDGLLSIDKVSLTLEALLGLSTRVEVLNARLVELEGE